MAYKQPITRAEVEAIRGVNIGGIVRNLMERRLVKIIGKKDVPGKPMLYGTTQEFLQYFGLKDLSSLPTLKEFQELETGEEVMEEISVGHETVLLPDKSASEESAEHEAVATTQENGSG
jgi:segregation and condensation protein B